MPFDDDQQAEARGARLPQERPGALLDAVVALSSGAEVPDVLSHVVRTACSLVGARHGAFGVLHPDGEQLTEFVSHGADDERRAVGELPHGRGTLEVPVRIRDELFGTLYLAEKQGAPEFSPEDEALLTALAAVAGVAIDHARLRAASKRQHAWSEAVADLTQTLLAGPQEQPALDKMVTLAGENALAALVFVLLYDEDGSLVVRARHVGGAGRQAPEATALGVGSRIDPTGWGGITAPVVSRRGEAAGLWPDDVTHGIDELTGGRAGGVAVVPLGPGRDQLGFLVVVWDEDDAPDDEETRPLLEFGQHAGLTLLAARAQRDQSLLALLDDRDRIARDMHDHVIQRLFATGLSLQSAARLAVHPTVRERLDDAVDDLDGAIKDIRHTIYELHRMPAGTLRDEIAELIGEASEALRFEPALLIEGRLAGLTDSLVADLLAVVREALANAAKHARATAVRVHVRCDEQVRVVVTDDGVGMDPASARSGLVNLGTRAAARGGRFEINPGAPRGTELSWTVPADRDS